MKEAGEVSEIKYRGGAGKVFSLGGVFWGFFCPIYFSVVKSLF